MSARNIILTMTLAVMSLAAKAQSAQAYFNTAANHYVQSRLPEAGQECQAGLKKYPRDPKLLALMEKLKKDEQKKQDKKDEQKKNEEKKDQQDQKDQNQKDQEQKDQEQKDQKDQKDQNKKDQEQKDKDQKDKEGKEQEKKDQNEQKENPEKDQDQQQKEKKEDNKVPQDVAERLKEMKMSEEKAQMILDAMKNQEVQYLQQNKRKPTKARDKSKPDW